MEVDDEKSGLADRVLDAGTEKASVLDRSNMKEAILDTEDFILALSMQTKCLLEDRCTN